MGSNFCKKVSTYVTLIYLLSLHVQSSSSFTLNVNSKSCPQVDVNALIVHRNRLPISAQFQLIGNATLHSENALNRCVEECCELVSGCEAARLQENVCYHYRCLETIGCNVAQTTEETSDSNKIVSLIVFVAPPNESQGRPLNRVHDTALDSTGNSSTSSDKASVTTVTSNVVAKLTVSAGENRIIQLPQDSIVINAFVVPPGNEYKYQWSTLNSQPDARQDIGTMQDQNTASLKLSALKAGLYSFKLTVDGSNSFGETFVNITVLPPKRVNKPPVVVIQPSNPVVKLPTKETILDGSLSTDDDRIVAYQWEPIQVPIGYQMPAEVDLNTATLQLRNLVAGAYSFNLTVKDSDNATSWDWANVTVLKEIDYPPTAVAGADIIIHLPQNEVVLNGTASTDDKGIVSWLWTRNQDEEDRVHAKPVDMDGTTTPILRLSKLDVGVYKFVLKVTDTSNQTSTSETHVFVKPEENVKPQADAGPNQQLSMPLEHDLVLDGSASKDASVNGIFAWNWTQLAGPRQSNIVNGTAAKTVVTGLIPGVYTFNLTVTNNKNLTDWSTINVTVTQSRNVPPIADAGGDQTITCPCDLVLLNGSRSHDDIGIVKYKWTREPNSLAAGNILNQSDQQSILELANLVEGHYQFRLTVTDTQGASNSDLVSLNVKESPNRTQQVETLLNTDVRSLTFEQLNILLKRFEILLSTNVQGEQTQITQLELHPRFSDKKVLLVFGVSVNGEPLSAPEVVRRLRDKIRQDKSLLVPEVLGVNPVQCQSDCSKHGRCDPYTKQCVCDPFWMQNFVRIRFGDQESNCDWSVLYVVLIFSVILVSICSVFWCLICLLLGAGKAAIAKATSGHGKGSARYGRKSKKQFNKKLKSLKYTLLQNGNGVEEMDSSDDDDRNDHKRNLSFVKRKMNLTDEHIELDDTNDSNSMVLNNLKRNKGNQGLLNGIKGCEEADSVSSDSDVMIFDSQNQSKTNNRRVHWQKSLDV
jgi:hypothetical protein